CGSQRRRQAGSDRPRGPTGRREQDRLTVERVRLEPAGERTDRESLPRLGERPEEVLPAQVPCGRLVETEPSLERDDLLLGAREQFFDGLGIRATPVEVPGRVHERLGARERSRETGADDHRVPDPEEGLTLTNFRQGANEETRLREGKTPPRLTRRDSCARCGRSRPVSGAILASCTPRTPRGNPA